MRLNPVDVEVVSFLVSRPHWRVDTHSRSTLGGRIGIDALINQYPRIEEEAYEAAF